LETEPLEHKGLKGFFLSEKLRKNLLEVKPNGIKAWRYRFELNGGNGRKESVFAIGDYAIAPKGNRPNTPRGAAKGAALPLQRHAMSA